MLQSPWCSMCIKTPGVPVMAQWLMNPTRNQEVVGLIPGLAQGVKDPVLLQAAVMDAAQLQCGCGVGRQLQLSFDRELPCAPGAALKSKKKKKKKKKKLPSFIF